jgi:hypothetical protein
MLWIAAKGKEAGERRGNESPYAFYDQWAGTLLPRLRDCGSNYRTWVVDTVDNSFSPPVPNGGDHLMNIPCGELPVYEGENRREPTMQHGDCWQGRYLPAVAKLGEHDRDSGFPGELKQP